MVYSQAYAIRKHLGMLPAFLHNKIYFGNGRKKVLTKGERRSNIGDVRGKSRGSIPKETRKKRLKKTSKK